MKCNMKKKHDTYELMLILCSSVYAMMHIKHDGTFELCSAKTLTHFKLKFYTNTHTHAEYVMSYSNYRYDSLRWVEWKFCRLMEDGGWVKKEKAEKTYTHTHIEWLKNAFYNLLHVHTMHIFYSFEAAHLSHTLTCGN